MSIIEIRYPAKCKDCKYWDTSVNPNTKRRQSFCKCHNIFIRKDDLACKEFSLDY